MKTVRMKYKPPKRKKKIVLPRLCATSSEPRPENKFEGIQWNLRMPGTVYQ
jgi:hypothetical protein